MLVRVNYSGDYPLGSDVKINNVKIMQSIWNEYDKSVIVYGHKALFPFYNQLFYVITSEGAVFFAAFEYDFGHYHIFTVSEKQNKKLAKRIILENQKYTPIAVTINNLGNEVRVYGRIVSGARDVNFKVADNAYFLTDVEKSANFMRCMFTNNGNDRYYLDVYNPSLIDDSESLLIIGKADKIVWLDEANNIRQEYRLLDAYVELTRSDANEKETLYYR